MTDGSSLSAGAYLRSVPNGTPTVHAGFYKAFLAVKAQVQAHVEELLCNMAKPVTLMICGHSLGGALATMACAYIAERLQSILADGEIEVVSVTLGAPRVGNP